MLSQTTRRTCADCGEYNPSKKSAYCGRCRADHPHAFEKPSADLKRHRASLAQANCHCEDHPHAECAPNSDGHCARSGGATCMGYVIAAPIHSCGVCRFEPDNVIHAVAVSA